MCKTFSYKRSRLIEIFGFTEQEYFTFGLGYSLTLERNQINNVTFRKDGAAVAKTFSEKTSCYAEKFKPTFDNQQLVADQMLEEKST